MNETVRLNVRRQDGPNAGARWEAFSLPYVPNMNVISCLQDIQANPVNAAGQKVAPVVWDCNCLEEVCGACSMIINGTARQACTALIDEIGRDLTLEPLSKFPLVRDLMVDRQVMFDNLKRIKGWIPLDGTYDLGPAPRMPEKNRQFAYTLSRCMTCGCCMEACPQVNARSNFIGPAAVSQALYFTLSPLGEMDPSDQYEAVMGDGGLTECGNAQNCVQACPKEIPLTTSIGRLNRATTWYALRNWLTK